VKSIPKQEPSKSSPMFPWNSAQNSVENTAAEQRDGITPITALQSVGKTGGIVPKSSKNKSKKKKKKK
jgi:hypothetical protein